MDYGWRWPREGNECQEMKTTYNPIRLSPAPSQRLLRSKAGYFDRCLRSITEHASIRTIACPSRFMFKPPHLTSSQSIPTDREHNVVETWRFPSSVGEMGNGRK